MARIITYTFMWVGLMILLYLSGIQQAGFSALLFSMGITMSPSGIAVNILTIGAISIVLGIFVLGVATGTITVGFITRQTTESSLIAPLASALAIVMTSDIIATIAYFFAYAPNAIAWIVTLFLLPFWATYIISIVQWWRGSDI